MKKLLTALLFAGLAISVKAQYTVPANTMTGDPLDACTVILCLAGGTNGGATCQKAITKYFSIHGVTASETIKKREDFLNLCPTNSLNLPIMGDMTANNLQMAGLKNIISKLQNDCSVESLNSTLENAGEIDGTPVYRIISTVPEICQRLYDHAFRNTEAQQPVNTCSSDEKYTREGWESGTQTYYYYANGFQPHIIQPETGNIKKETIRINYNCWQ